MDTIDASSVARLHEAFIAARTDFEAAIRVAGDCWEDKILEPEDGGPRTDEGSPEPWPPHMAAAHALLGERWRFRHIEAALDQPADAPAITNEAFSESPAGEEERTGRRERYDALTGAEPAIAAAAQEWTTIDAIYERLEDTDLARAFGLNDGQLGYLESQGQTSSRDIRGALKLAVAHLTDHAQQLRSVADQ